MGLKKKGDQVFDKLGTGRESLIVFATVWIADI